MSVTIAGIRIDVSPCSDCGIQFGLPEAYADKRREDHKTFLCPNGHSQYYPQESEAEKYKRLYQQSERRAGANYDRAERVERSLAATRGVVTKLRKRAHAGVCPFGCHRNFANLQRHVATKHPGEKLEGEDAPSA